MKKLIAGFLCFFMLFAIVGCKKTEQVKATTAKNQNAFVADASVHIHGEGVDSILTNEDFKNFALHEVTTSNVDSAGNTAEVTFQGFSLKEILLSQKEPVDLSTIGSVDLKASDGYIMNVANGEYADRDIYLIAVNDEGKLDYPRSAIPDKRAMYWVRNLNDITLKGEVHGSVSETQQSPVRTIHFFREETGSLPSHSQHNHGTDVNAYSLQEYFDTILKSTSKKDVVMMARDGFKKTETMDVLLSNYVTFEGIEYEEDQVPLYFSTDIKNGMRVKQLDAIISEDTALYFGEETTLLDLMKEVGMVKADTYTFTCSDGFTMDIPYDALSSGRIYLDADEGFVRSDFGSYDVKSIAGKGKAKHLVSITAVNTKTEGVEKGSDVTLLKCFVGGQKKMLSEKDFMLLPQDTQTISKTNSHGVSTTADYTGVHFADICQAIGADPQTAQVTLVASDGYESSPTNAMLNDPQSLFALYQNGTYIDSEGDGRVWFTCSENFTANNWAKYITKIVIE